MTSSNDLSSRTGRRPGANQTRTLIVTAARAQFAEAGYDRATFRSIATAAGVDPALVVHFFGSKANLFHEVMQLPPAVADALVTVADGPPEQMGRRLAQMLVGALENPETRPVVLGRIRCASSHPEAAELVRETVSRDLGRLTSAVSTDRPDARAVMIGVQVVGIALARYVVKVEPLASASPADVVELLAPSFQRYLVEPLET